MKHSSSASYDNAETGYFLIGFFIPIAGLILYLMMQETQTKNANAAGKGALIGVIAGFVLGMLMFFFILSFQYSIY